ncbi:Zn(II)2Cys6 transcription factor [Penicillium longicatenatum]|uniref:Zn(II)2Cys6 transcription factor n=1 Tax=Penicillium longicatenatum TaxID=1561947 RepID=UPI002549694E|nr:Zn(II)2Cys6 transcription factor [Penicillium longicatenatum]KAJ5649228.1 Zn(II)2Cys6 transcription factor [Penicillium longicatenatum]
MDNFNTHASPYPYDTARVSELLKRKRRVRGIKSCFPCRHRKVKCSGDLPCESCVSRGHPELCCVPSESGGNSRPTSTIPGHSVPQESHHVAREPDEADGDWLRREHGRKYVTYPITIRNPYSSLPSTRPAIGNEHENESTADHTIGIDLMIKRLEGIEEQISSLKAELQQTHAGTSINTDLNSHEIRTSNSRINPHMTKNLAPGLSGKNFVEDATGATIFLGSHSDPPAALGCRNAPGDGILSDDLFLDQIAPRMYPFTSMWGPDAGAADICRTLPDDSDVIRYSQIYQTTVYPFYPALVTLEQFNSSLFAFLDRRAELQQSNETSKLDDSDTSWLALLFAVLACGVQFSNDPIKERDLLSKVFICSSFQCLRISNFFNNTDMDQIQAMALIGHCIRNNLDTNSAWILLGSTMRLAQSIGLHEETIEPDSPNAAHQFQRKRLWWVLLWQDTFLSFTYDRPPSTIKSSENLPYDSSNEAPGTHSFADSIMTLCQIMLERAQKDEVGSIRTIMGYKHRIERILDEDFAAPYLRNKARCRTLQQHLERLALQVHYSYVIMRLCRLALDIPDPIPNDTKALKQECARRASDAVEAFLEVHRLSSMVCRSWAFVHNAVSCAFTLKNLGPEVFPLDAELLITRLVVVLESEESLSSWVDSDTNVRYYGPYSRALRALKEFVS